MRERISVTLEPDLVAAIDTLVDRQTLRNRSHAIEHLLKEGLGLHQLEQAFFFLGEGWQPAQLQEAAATCAGLGLREVFLSPGNDEAAAIVRTAAPGLAVTPVAADFGSGGAILLTRERLDHPVLLFWIDAKLHIPSNLIAAYAFHRQHHRLLTQCLLAEDGGFVSAGVDILEPEAASQIPAGVVSLRDRVFPDLATTTNVRAYVTRR